MTDDAGPPDLPQPRGVPADLPPPAGLPGSVGGPAGGGPEGPVSEAPVHVWGRRGGLPSWKVLAGVGAAVVVVAGGIALAAGGGGGGSDCTKALFSHFRRGDDLGALVVATDLAVARDHGYRDDGTLEELGRSQRQTGTYPGLVTTRFRVAPLYSTEEFTARTGVEPGDIDCAVGNLTYEVSSGRFDAPEVAGSATGDDGLLEATEDRLAMAGGPIENPARLLEPLDDDSLADDDDVTEAVDHLLERDAYSYAIEFPAEDPADDAPRLAAAGVAEGDNDERVVVVLWVFGDDDAATAGRTAMADHLRDVYRDVASIDPDGVEVDGRVAVGAFPMRQPDRWLSELVRPVSLLPEDPGGDD